MNNQIDKLDFVLSKLKEIESDEYQSPYTLIIYDDYSGRIDDYDGNTVFDFEDYAELVAGLYNYTKENK